MKTPREKQHRLPRERYQGQQIVAFTTRLENRFPLFEEPRRSNDFGAILIEEAAKHSCDLVIACLMPDHGHAILQGRDENADSLEAFYKFKLRTGVYLDRFCRPAHWQKDFYDHIVRCDEDWGSQAKYICLNPVRGQLLEDPFDYPFIYSSLGTRHEVMSQIFGDA